MSTGRTKVDFFNDIDKLININNKPENDAKLEVLDINGNQFGPNDMITIVEGIKNADKKQLNRLNDLKEYLFRTIGYIRFTIPSRPKNDNSLLGRRIQSKIEEGDSYQMLSILMRLSKDLMTNNISDFFGIATPTGEAYLYERMTRGTIPEREMNEINEAENPAIPDILPRIPEDVAMKEIFEGYLGKKIAKGGRTKRRNKNRKGTKKRKGRKTIKRKVHRRR